MASFTGANGAQVSAAMLPDPKALKKHLANGTPISSHFEPSSLPARRGSEPPCFESSLEIPFVPDIASQQSKDDAYHALDKKGRKAIGSQSTKMAGQAASNTFDPRRLLDPKGFNNDQRQRDSKSASTELTLPQPTSSNLQLSSDCSETNGSPVGTHVNGLHKRDHGDHDGLGMGSLIEKVHNVSQREERPRKKPKVENGEFDVEEDKKVNFAGGGKGGEIGEYLKEQKKQGIAESRPDSAVVDLTGGPYLRPSKAFLRIETNWYFRR